MFPLDNTCLLYTSLVKIEGVLGDKVAPNAARWYAIKLFEAEDKTIADLKLSQADLDAISAIRTRCV